MVKKVEDIDQGWDDLSDANKAFITGRRDKVAGAAQDNAACVRQRCKVAGAAATPPAAPTLQKSRGQLTAPAARSFIHPRTRKWGACAECA